jgi:hypothetical protein
LWNLRFKDAVPSAPQKSDMIAENEVRLRSNTRDNKIRNIGLRAITSTTFVSFGKTK